MPKDNCSPTIDFIFHLTDLSHFIQEFDNLNLSLIYFLGLFCATCKQGNSGVRNSSTPTSLLLINRGESDCLEGLIGLSSDANTQFYVIIGWSDGKLRLLEIRTATTSNEKGGMRIREVDSTKDSRREGGTISRLLDHRETREVDLGRELRCVIVTYMKLHIDIFRLKQRNLKKLKILCLKTSFAT